MQQTGKSFNIQTSNLQHSGKLQKQSNKVQIAQAPINPP